MVEFGGWEMPVEYAGIISEHLAVRNAAGLFDVSHMGEIEVRGPKAAEFLQRITCNNVFQLQLFQAQYSALMEANGAAVDDCVVHRLGPDDFFICVNAANTEKDYQHLLRHNAWSARDVFIENASAKYAQLAVQGPRAVEIMARVADGNPGDLRRYWCRCAKCCGVEGLLARTGYTGEDGYEFYFPAAESRCVWDGLLDAGRFAGLIPAGLGARNTLRLEAAYPLYGHELDAETTLLEANLGWICKLQKGEFLGSEKLAQQKDHGVDRKLVGFEMLERGIARDGYPVWMDGECRGRVTSGSYAPCLKKNIGLALVTAGFAGPGRAMQVEIRGKLLAARQTELPFYKRPL